ncbi:malectin/receptor-like protein kinase family protein [Actinidia rufa]|uniref:non-specific serine/threonine protein kinase n=1 Tax=Actinidia rufa TaxID=165716 RepID=A0A7J0H8C2_9ERIC|nr:malectin/receptor-like protein kinase family protein [Actinidia rufa]
MSAVDSGTLSVLGEVEESCRRFSLVEIQRATNNFDDALIIGKGGFGKVYKGIINYEATSIAIKRLNAESKQGAREFWTEIKTLSMLRHPHLVTLIGYSDDCEEMLLVYEYMANGTLADHLYKISRNRNGNNTSHLTWEQRLNICIGAARGLDYLHSNEQSVIHRDVKTTNILLDENWEAKISDFGLSKMGTTQSHVSVVLLEVLCARPPVDARVEEEQQGLASWAQQCMKKGRLDQIIDPSLRGKIFPHCLKMFAEVANKCLHNHPKGRPTMAEIVESLKLILESQDTMPKCDKIIGKVFLTIPSVAAKGVVFGERMWKDYGSNNGLPWQLRRDPFAVSATKLYRRFTLAEIRVATNNFHEQLVIGDGGYTKVYKGLIDRGSVEVAIRRWKEGTSNEKNLDQYKAEIQVQSQLRHLHIVPLIGYCNKKNELILVYEYLVNGSLYHHLYEVRNDHLPWEKRLEICIGTARAMQYLHAGIRHTIIHHNLKPTTILLDENWVAKVSGFEFSTILPSGSSTTFSTFVAGAIGYMDPEYLASAQLTTKSDVYSFGVILLELLCGRKPMIITRNEDHVNLVRWFKTNIEKGTVDQVIYPYLVDKIAPECLKEYVWIAENCVRDEGMERPSMDDVLGSLRYALQLQEDWRIKMDEAILPSHDNMVCDGIVTVGIAGGGDTGGMSFRSLGDSDYFSDVVHQSDEFCHRFALAEIQSATNNFDDALVIGSGGFGKVYKGFINDGATTVAIKRLNAESKQGAKKILNRDLDAFQTRTHSSRHSDWIL